MTLPVPIDTPRPLVDLAEAGVAVWLDDLSRPLVRQGGLADLVRTRGVIGVTTNPTIFASAVAGTDAYDAQLAQLANAGRDAEAAVRTLTTDDVRDACDVLAEVYAPTDGVDGRVSIEVDPASRTTPRPRSPRPGSSGPRSTDRTCSSRSRRPSRACPRSPRTLARASASTSR